MSVALTIRSRHCDEPWTTTTLTDGDILAVPEIGIEVPVAALQEGVTFAETQPGTPG